jgi:dTDP-4-dehydrorhamnose 3,5-epimerase
MMQKFSVKDTTLKDAKLIELFSMSDERGTFTKDYERSFFESFLVLNEGTSSRTVGVEEEADWQLSGSDNSADEGDRFSETFFTSSARGVIRGMHFQYPNPQVKIVSCVAGKAVDVILDLRKDSLTFGKAEAFTLDMFDSVSPRAVLVPEGFAHGFISLMDNTIISYKCIKKFDPVGDGGIRWDDPSLSVRFSEIAQENGISASELVISQKDRGLESIAEFLERTGGGF